MGLLMAIIVGDIHGDLDKAKAFLTYKPEALHVALGDYLDSFLEPVERQIETLQMLMDSSAVLLLGNHEVHYLDYAPFQFAGYNFDHWHIFQEIIEKNLQRFTAAYAVDGWLCTHAGMRRGLSRLKDVDHLAKILNLRYQKFLVRRFYNYGKPTEYRGQSIFYHNYWMEEDSLASVKQIFGHVEQKQPYLTVNYIALDTTNFTNSCWVYDTEAAELVQLPLAVKIGRVRLEYEGLW